MEVYIPKRRKTSRFIFPPRSLIWVDGSLRDPLIKLWKQQKTGLEGKEDGVCLGYIQFEEPTYIQVKMFSRELKSQSQSSLSALG